MFKAIRINNCLQTPTLQRATRRYCTSNPSHAHRQTAPEEADLASFRSEAHHVEKHLLVEHIHRTTQQHRENRRKRIVELSRAGKGKNYWPTAQAHLNCVSHTIAQRSIVCNALILVEVNLASASSGGGLMNFSCAAAAWKEKPQLNDTATMMNIC